MSILEIRDVEVEYLRRDGVVLRAVAGASLSVEPGEIVGLVGETGCGKSSLMKAGLLPRLAKTVTAVYVEATGADTEARLLKE